jgi:serine/threonine protein kinase
MKAVEVERKEGIVRKTSHTPEGYRRLVKEKTVLETLAGLSYVPRLVDSKKTTQTIWFETEYIEGESLKQWIGLNDGWSSRALPWKEARTRLEQYIAVEMDLLAHGALYRDLNLEHIIFTKSGVVLIDFESTIIKSPHESWWMLNDIRGTHETMAPEEFPVRGILGERIATYRAAVLAYIILTGTVPFARKKHRSQTYAWRKVHLPRIAAELPVPVRRVFASALSRQAVRRHKDPQSFLDALTRAYET